MIEEENLKEKPKKKNKNKKNKSAKKSKQKDSSFPVVEENIQEVVKVEEKPLITLGSSKEDIVDRVQQTNDIEELKDLTNLFGISLTKREIIRASKESDLMDKL